MLILGLGLGLVMQVLVLAVQNAVSYGQLGVATSAATLFRSIGGSLGTAILGAIFSNRLANELAWHCPRPPVRRHSAPVSNPAQVEALPAGLRDVYINSFTDSLSLVFLIAAAVVAAAFAIAWLLQERPAPDRQDADPREPSPPLDADSLREITRS